MRFERKGPSDWGEEEMGERERERGEGEEASRVCLSLRLTPVRRRREGERV